MLFSDAAAEYMSDKCKRLRATTLEGYSSGNEMQDTYGPESNNYKAGAYYSSGKVYLRSSSRYDGATLIVL